jgi:Type I phosphodiesterase / nucleotide pyrophosphatase
MLAELFKFVDQKVGLANTVIVLSADHGAAEIPGYLSEFGIDAKYFKPDALDPKTLVHCFYFTENSLRHHPRGDGNRTTSERWEVSELTE